MKNYFLPVSNLRWVCVNNSKSSGTHDVVEHATADSFEVIGAELCGADELNEINADFMMFKLSPEYRAIQLIGSMDADRYCGLSAKEAYETIIEGCSLIRAHRRKLDVSSEACSTQIDRCRSWLSSTDFYAAPASTQYHDSCVGGLVRHTLNVIRNIYNLWALPAFETINIEDAVIVAAVHDWCKIGLYKPYQRNVKNESTGKWEQVTAYKYGEEIAPLGHGVSSLFLANSFFTFSMQEAAAIRWHMGVWRVVDSEMNTLQHCNETYPIVHMLQFADQLAITTYA